MKKIIAGVLALLFVSARCFAAGLQDRGAHNL